MYEGVDQRHIGAYNDRKALSGNLASSVANLTRQADSSGTHQQAAFAIPGTSGNQGMNEVREMGAFLQNLGAAGANRGVSKAQFTPAEMNGQMPLNPNMFNKQAVPAIPYQKMVNNGQNLALLMNGFQERASKGGGMPQDVSDVMGLVQKAQSLMSTAFNNRSRVSLYEGVPRDAAVNLYQINLRNTRANSMYSFE